MLNTAILRIQCADQPGIVAKVSNWVFEQQGNILSSHQFSTDPTQGQFYMRLEFCFEGESPSREDLGAAFAPLAQTLKCEWDLHYKQEKSSLAILISKQDHCLYELLYQWHSKEIRADITAIISNHREAEALAKSHNLPFHYLPISKETKQVQEQQLLNLVKDTTDFLVLARYMQILSPEFLEAYQKDIINIHHSFLPSFVGAYPYQQAYDRGVKLIGATAHYVTEALDEGPIIAQKVEPVSHHDDVDTLRRKGKHIEKLTLAQAVMAHCERRVIRMGNKTIVFD